MSNTTPHYLFLTTSTRESGHLGNTEWLAQQAAAALPAGTVQTWHHLARMHLPPFVDLRHTVGTYPAPEGDLKTLLDATLAATHIVFVSPVYWFSIPSPLKTYLDHWSGWMRVPGLPPATFSGGEQQRINIARNMIKPKPLLLLDEPTASLDAANTETVIGLIREAVARGAALVGIFHDAHVGAAVATRRVNVGDFRGGAA